MADFNPDAYLAKKSGGAGGFDPDAYLAKKMPMAEEKPKGLLASQFGEENIKAALGTLPTIGSIAGGIGGGIAGAAGGPVGVGAGGIAGAGLGQGAGEALRQAGESYFLGEEKDVGQAAKDVAQNIGEGAAYQAVGGAVVKGAGKGLGLVAKTGPGKAAIETGKKALSKTGEALTGVPEKVLRTYAKYADEIKDLGKRASGDMQLAADEVKRNFMTQIQATRQSLNRAIEGGLTEYAEKSVDSKPVLSALDKVKSRIDADLQPEMRAEIDDIAGIISRKIKPDGSMSLPDANAVKQFLQDAAAPSYSKGGQIFQRGKQSQQAAKAAAAEVRGLINKEAPKIRQANESLAKLHRIEDSMNKNLLAEGKPASALVAAGSGGNLKNAMEIQQLGQLTGTNMLGEAEKLAALQYLGNPQYLPIDTTGKSALRTAIGTGIGGAIGGFPGAAVGGALTSPLMAKTLIDAGRLGVKGARKAAPVVVPVAEQAVGRGLLQTR
jgi:hypothetical protein